MQSLRLSNFFGTTLPAVYLKQFESGREHSLFVWSQSSSLPRFELTIHDSVLKPGLCRHTLSVFIIPQSQEGHWTFTTLEGREQLAQTLKATRLVLIKLGHGQQFSSLVEVQKELMNTIKDLKPGTFPGKVSFYCNEVPANRRTLAIDGEVIVEEIRDQNHGIRSLWLSSCLSLVQSEVRISSNGNCDFGELLQEDTKMMASGLALMVPNSPAKIAILGGGAGILAQFLSRNFNYMDVVSVERNATVLKVPSNQLAKTHFSLEDAERLHIINQDAVDYISDLHQRKEMLSAVVIDINGESVKSPVPPTAFRVFWFILQIKEILNADAVLVVNAVHRCSNHRIELVNVLKDCFPFIYFSKCENESHEVFYALKVSGKYIPKVHSQWKQRMRAIETEHRWSPRMKLWKIADRIHLEFPIVEVQEQLPDLEVKKKDKRCTSSNRVAR